MIKIRVIDQRAECQDCTMPLDVISDDLASHTCWQRQHREAAETLQAEVVKALRLREICEWLTSILTRAKP